MKNTRNLHGARCRARWAAALAVGAVVVLAPSPAWSQDRGGVTPSETPRPTILSLESFQEAGFLRLRPQPRATFSTVQQKIDGPSIGVFTSPFGMSDGPVVSLNVVVPQQNGKDEGELVSYAGLGGGTLGTYILRRVVMAAVP